MKNIILILSILFCYSTYLPSQTPKRIERIQKKLSSIYAGQNSNTKNNEVEKLTSEIQSYYDSITEYYRYYGSKKQIVKGSRLYIDNDVFSFVDNRDHEYTGGFRIEVITDYFGLKLLSFRREEDYLSYQSILFGFELYTPNRLNVRDINDLDERDRPFASFQYFGRSRNIIRYDGKHRSSGVIKIGIIGGNVSRNFQRIVHRDITDSENNNGWDFQIANGGRFAIQYDLRNEWLHRFGRKNLYLNYGFETKVGFEKMSITPIFSFTNKSFFEKNPHYAINSTNPHFSTQPWCQQFFQTLFFEAKLEPEIVIYNSMLQGYIIKNEEFIFNETTNLNEEIPIISDINRIVGRFSLGFGFRNYDSTLLFEYYFQTPEYDYSWKDKYFHRYARLSFTMNL